MEVEAVQSTSESSDPSTESPSFLDVPWGLHDVALALLVTLAIFLLTIGVVGFPLLVTYWLAPDLYPAVRDAMQSPLFQAAILLPPEAAFLVPVWWLGVRKYGCTWRFMGLRPFNTVPGLVTAFALLGWFYALNCCYVGMLGFLLPGFQPPPIPIPMGEGWLVPLLTFLSLSVVAPFTEELLFRGFVFRGLCRRMSARWAAVLAAAVFALPHLDVARMAPLFALGLILTYLYVRTGSLIPSILVHATVNSLSFLLLILLRDAGYTSV